MTELFQNRTEAGSKLARKLKEYAGRTDTLILALPRGGVPVAYEIARTLSLPLDIWLVRKLGVPGHEELAMGAIAMGNIIYLNHELIGSLSLSDTAVEAVIARESVELHKRNSLYRQDRPLPDLEGKTVIVVDDGLATGATMRAAVMSLHETGVRHIIIAAPVGSASTCQALEDEADEIVCLVTPEPFYGVGQWYADFSQTSDEGVQNILRQFEHA